MFTLFPNRKRFSKVVQALMITGFLFVILQTSTSKARSMIEKARQEGTLTLYSGLTIPDTQFVGNAFMKKYPFIDFKFIRTTGGGRLQRLIMEKQAGIRKADVYQVMVADISIFKNEGLIQKYVSPETRNWPEGFQDPEGYWTAYYTSYNAWIYNARMVPEAEAPKCYEDLLDPKWKGKIGLGTSEYEWYQGMMDFMGREKGLLFMKRLADQDIRINNGKTLTMQLMASGEFPIAKGVLHRALQMSKKGAPIQLMDFPTPTLAGIRACVLHADAPHPNAGKLFIDFMLSSEGQEILNKLDRHPIRMDIEVDPVIDKVRRKLFPIRSASAEESTAYMKEFFKLFSIR